MEEGKKRIMETVNRKPLQGAMNIIRFNWHFYLVAAGATAILLYTAKFLTPLLQLLIMIIALCIIMTLLTSLAVSYYIYDRSPLYSLDWLPAVTPPHLHIVNIHAGFDETSALLAQKFPGTVLTVLDFYDPQLHTEVSIRRARKAYPAYPGTQTISTANVPLAPQSVDHIYLILAAHEIRSDTERAQFFRQLRNALRTGGRITVVEHLRDINNLLAYNIGAFHFLSRRTWLNTFAQAGLQVDNEFSLTPFIAIYTLTH
jgi:SAM-dependent methyltransferase